MYNTPVLFLIFNREDTTQKVFEAIRLQKPKYLFVAADGPRKNKEGETEKCRRVRELIQVDWDCELKTLFRAENLGCKTAVSEAITWFFDQVEQGIILEDDCLPDPSFFLYCEELLDRYKDDTRIGHIGGNCFLPGIIQEDLSYDFCSFAHIWGWASWRRVWKNYDVNLSYWTKYKNNRDKIDDLFNSMREKTYFSSFISDTLSEKKKINTWDTQYQFSLRTQSQLSIYPAVNLVTNIGLDSETATHTKGNNHKLLIPASAIQLPLKHPQYIMRNKKIDNTSLQKIHFSWKRLVRYYLKNF